MTRTNLAIARVLTEIGDLLEIKGENPFKIRAYRNAAETIVARAAAVDTLSDAERRALPGIGNDIAAKIAELVETGAIAYHQELVAGVSSHASWTCSTCRGRTQDGRVCSTGSSTSGRSPTWRPPPGPDRLRAIRGMGARKEAQILKALADTTLRTPAAGSPPRRTRPPPASSPS